MRSSPSILSGATYTHRPTGRQVTVVDFEFRARRRARTQSAPTGRHIVRDPNDPGLPEFLVRPQELEISQPD